MEERILIVDDDITFALMLRTWLSKRGFGVGTASSVAAARTALEAGGFSLVLSDMRLPDEDGIALLQWMAGAGVAAPVIVMTSYAEIQNAVRCMKLGARDYVAKPVNPDELLKKIREALDVPAAPAAKSASKPAPRAAGSWSSRSTTSRAAATPPGSCTNTSGWWPRPICRCWSTARAARARSMWRS